MNIYKKVLAMVGFVLVLGLTIGGLSVLVRPVNTDNAFNAIETFHQQPEQSIDVIGFGSSHMFREFVPMELYTQYGIGAYNYGCNWQRINTTALFIKDALKTQSPDLILIETYQVNLVKQS